MRALIVNAPVLTMDKTCLGWWDQDWVVEHVENVADGIKLLQFREFDIMVLMLETLTGLGTDAIRRIRASRLEIPIIMVSSTTDTVSTIAALAAGADDVIVLPVNESELRARMHAIVRRSRGYSHHLLTVDKVSLNLQTLDVVVDGKMVHLTTKEVAVLQLLMLRCNFPVAKETILNQLYADVDHEPESTIINVFVSKIRKKLADAGAPDLIETAWGRGYMVRSTAPKRMIEPLARLTSAALFPVFKEA